jgi:hypothetical protein
VRGSAVSSGGLPCRFEGHFVAEALKAAQVGRAGWSLGSSGVRHKRPGQARWGGQVQVGNRARIASLPQISLFPVVFRHSLQKYRITKWPFDYRAKNSQLIMMFSRSAPYF